MEKRGYIDPKWTPDTESGEKQAISPEQKIDQLDNDVTKRLAEGSNKPRNYHPCSRVRTRHRS